MNCKGQSLSCDTSSSVTFADWRTNFGSVLIWIFRLFRALQGRIWHKNQSCKYKKSVFVSGAGKGFFARSSRLKLIGKNAPFVSTLLAHFTKVICPGIWKTRFVRPSSSILMPPDKTSQRIGSVNSTAFNPFGINVPLAKEAELRSKYILKQMAIPRLPVLSKKRDSVTLSERTSISFPANAPDAKSPARPRTRDTGFPFPSFGIRNLPHMLENGGFGRFSNPSTCSSGFTKIVACASKAKIGWFCQSLLIASWLTCQTSNAANPNPNMTSATIPIIKIHQPISDFNLFRLASPIKLERCSFLSASSASFSIQSPKNTISPPMLASSGIRPDHEYETEKTRRDMVALKISAAINLTVLLTIGIAFLIRFHPWRQ